MKEGHEHSTDSELADAVKWATLQRAVEERSIESAFEIYRGHGLEPILIKGWAAARNYSDDKVRTSSDIDLAFAASDFDKALEIARGGEFKGLVLDIHREFKHLDTLNWDDIYDRSQLVELGKALVRIPSAEDHLRILCVHWLIDGGWFRERLWDIHYAVDRRPSDFDWSKCLDVVSPNRRGWVICCIGLAHHYLGLNVDDLPFRNEAIELPSWLVNAVEKEWKSDLRLLPLQDFVSTPLMFLRQVKKRLPPNPITATLDVEGSFYATFRLHYQLGSIFKRLGPSLVGFKRRFSR